MRTHSLKPFDDGKYLSEEEALKLLESIPIPKDDLESTNLAEENSQTPAAEAPYLESRLIDLNPADNDAIKTQDDWIAYFKARNEIMVSTPDIYQASKSNNNFLLNSLRRNFNSNWFVTSTRIKYLDDDQKAIITHDYGSQLAPSVECPVFIPEYQSKLLVDVLNDLRGLIYLRALFGTKDGSYQIIDTLQKLSDCPIDKIRIWSTPLSDRPAERASGFDYSNNEFRIYHRLVNRGHSRRILSFSR